jgi:hypothetical protein
MATQHLSLRLCRQTSFFPSSLPATSSLPGRAKISSFPRPFKLLHCSSLRIQCTAAGSKDQLVSEVHESVEILVMELPPLLASMAIPGLPPCQESMYADEALAMMLQRWPLHWLEPHNHVCCSFSSFMHCSAVSCDRLAVMSAVYTLLTFLDDNLFDVHNEMLLEEVGIDRTILRCPNSIKAYLHSLDVILRQEEPVQNPTQIKEMTWKLGRDLRELSNPEWFQLFTDAMMDFNISSLESYSADLVGDRTFITDLESFTQMHIRDSGSVLYTLGVEFCNNLFLSRETRDHPVVVQLTMASWPHFPYANGIFSYSKEQDEPQSRNLIKVLMESEGLSLPQAAWRAMNLTNAVAQGFMKMEGGIVLRMSWELEDRHVRRYVEGLKELMSGALYWHSLQKRYWHRKAPFPELRDVGNASYCPKAKDIHRV